MSSAIAVQNGSVPAAVVVTDAWRDRFWAKVEKGGECWIWMGGHVPRGYGRVCTKSIVGFGRQSYAHRMSWIMANGPIPDGMQVLHHCDTPACVKPQHLFLGDQLVNMRDMVGKGRSLTGERSPQSKLTTNDVAAMRERYAAGGVTFYDLARDYGIVFQHAHAIVRGARWGRAHGK